MKTTLCPFSKPIIGNWCQCQYAKLDDRCAGKMTCLKSATHLAGCYELVEIFKQKSHFILGITQLESELTHMQLMKIRCGGLMGMQRVLIGNTSVPNVLETMSLSEQRYGSVAEFPFSEIVRDIKEFSHRKKKHR